MSEQVNFNGSTPLAARMRPNRLEEILGQPHLLKAGSPLRQLTEGAAGSGLAKASILLWGPPGTGKTTIARVVARASSMRLTELSAISAGVKEVRDVIAKARDDRDTYGTETLLFLDEIHRFSKAQQDALLPAVEAGWITLIAATTENPSFSVVSPLLSRSIVLTLNQLEDDVVSELVNRAVEDQRGLAGSVALDSEVAPAIAQLASGDARRALTLLEAAAAHAQSRQLGIPKKGKAGSAKVSVTLEDLEATQQRAVPRYDRDGDMHYDIISAFIKSVRGSDADSAIHWLARMIEAGEDPRFIARRLIILASEDIGLADPQALPLAVAAAEAVALIGMPEGRIPLSEATIYLAMAPKSNTAYNAINEALDDVRRGLISEVPVPLRSSNYAGASITGAGKGYQYPHDDSRAVLEQRYTDDRLQTREYYRPKNIGAERELAERWPKLRAIIRAFKK